MGQDVTEGALSNMSSYMLLDSNTNSLDLTETISSKFSPVLVHTP